MAANLVFCYRMLRREQRVELLVNRIYQTLVNCLDKSQNMEIKIFKRKYIAHYFFKH